MDFRLSTWNSKCCAALTSCQISSLFCSRVALQALMAFFFCNWSIRLSPRRLREFLGLAKSTKKAIQAWIARVWTFKALKATAFSIFWLRMYGSICASNDVAPSLMLQSIFPLVTPPHKKWMSWEPFFYLNPGRPAREAPPLQCFCSEAVGCLIHCPFKPLIWKIGKPARESASLCFILAFLLRRLTHDASSNIGFPS